MKEILKYILSDYQRYQSSPVKWTFKTFLKILLIVLIGHQHCFCYSFWLRLSSRKTIFYPFARWKHWRLSRKYGIQIHPSTKIGYGLFIGHGVGIIINVGTTIGNNCNVSQFLSIGTNNKKAARIGDNVYIGPHVSIVGDVNIGNDVLIGAGSVVIKDIPSNSTAVGCPAKVIGENKHPEYCQDRWDCNQFK